MRVVNLSLLAKWCWRILQHDSPLWKEVLVKKFDRSGVTRPRSASVWWRDLTSLEDSGGGDWFKREVFKKVCDLFPRLLAITDRKDAKLSEVCVRNGEEWNWTWLWRRLLFVWDESLLEQLLMLLNDLVPNTERDSWG